MSFFNRNSSAARFTPHSFRNRTEYLDRGLPLETPKVFITPLALDKMYYYVDIGSKEVGWLGTAVQIGSNFLVEDVFLLKQKVHSTTTEITNDGLGDFTMEIIQTKPDKEAEHIINNLRFWGHSHVNMGTSPSGQDDHQMELFRQRGNPWFIRAILNKQGRLEITVYDYRRGIKVTDAEWAVVHTPDPTIRGEIQTEFDAKVTEMGYWGSSSSTYDYLRPYNRPTQEEKEEKEKPEDTAPATEEKEVLDIEIDEPAGDGAPIDLDSLPKRQTADTKPRHGLVAPSEPKGSTTLGERLQKVITEVSEETPEDPNLPEPTPTTTSEETATAQPRKRRWYFLWLY